MTPIWRRTYQFGSLIYKMIVRTCPFRYQCMAELACRCERLCDILTSVTLFAGGPSAGRSTLDEGCSTLLILPAVAGAETALLLLREAAAGEETLVPEGAEMCAGG